MYTGSDFWTTQCVKCPDALDKLDLRASESNLLAGGDDNEEAATTTQFISICCGDSCDAAREILEQSRERRWSHIDHYFMDFANKEKAKKLLGFQAVPFYVMLNDRGEIVQMGNKVDWSKIPGVEVADEEEDKENALPAPKDISGDTVFKSHAPSVVEAERLFELDDLDF